MLYAKRYEIVIVKRRGEPSIGEELIFEANNAIQSRSALGIPNGMVHQVSLINLTKSRPPCRHRRGRDLFTSICDIHYIDARAIARDESGKAFGDHRP